MDKSNLFFNKALIFKHIPLFSDFHFLEKKLLLAGLEITEYKKDQMIYTQGAAADAFYCIVTGRVQIFITKPDGAQETIEHIHRGNYFGLLSILTGEPHSVSARALNDTLIVKIPKRDFELILKKIPRLAIELSRVLSRRLKDKQLHHKTIFESTMIMVYGACVLIRREAFLYALNLACALKNQTGKKTIFVDAGSGEIPIVQIGSGGGRGFDFLAGEPLFSLEQISANIVRGQGQADVLRLFLEPKRPLTAHLTALLTTLANDYHYCVLHLPAQAREEILGIFQQSDLLFLLIPSQLDLISAALAGLRESGIWNDAQTKRRIRLIVVEEGNSHGKGAGLSHREEAAILHQPVFATLPRPAAEKIFSCDNDFQEPYAKAIRRISRQIGDVLVGLALGSGSAMGLAHIGVLKILEAERIPVDIVCGSSIGAFIGALWCSGHAAGEVEEIILKNKNGRYLFGFDDLVFPLRGFIRGKHIHRFLKKYLGNKTFYDINRTFKIVACDCLSMKPVVFETGRLSDAVLASISIPGVFSPHKIGEHFYIDGGIVDPLPTDILIESGAKKIISVNVLPSADEIERTYLMQRCQPPDYLKWPFLKRALSNSQKRIADFFRPNILDCIVSSVQSLEYLLAQRSSAAHSDVALHPDMTGVLWSSFANAALLIKRGQDEAASRLGDIKELTSVHQ